MKKAFKVIALIILSFIAILTIAYLALGFYYQRTFVFGTWINENYCTGMTVDEVNALLSEEYSNYTLLLYEKEDATESVTASQIQYEVDFHDAVYELKEKQNPLNWGFYIISPVHYEIEPKITYNEQMLTDTLKQLDCYRMDEMNRLKRPSIVYTNTKYALVDKKTEVIDEEKTTELIKQALNKHETRLSLIDNECYYMPERTAEEKEIYHIWEQIDAIQNTHIIYSDGMLKHDLYGQTATEWINKSENGEFLLNENNRLTLDREKVSEFLDQLALVFETSGGSRTWIRPDGKVITIQKRGKKYLIDREGETERIAKALSVGSQVTRKPLYSQVGEPREEIDMGETYIEIDMSAQKLYYYVNHALKLSTDVVTGKTAHGGGTPAAVCEVYGKQKNRTLRGENYASFVYYWMPIRGNIGIHDATWRDEFGGTIYKTAGSHGCINLPKEKAASLYDMVEVGTPVIMYY